MSANRSQRRRRRVLLAIAAAAVPLPAFSADRHWVGGSSFWELAGNWSATAGGAGGAGQPVNGDNAFISSSGNLVVTRDNLSTPPYLPPGMALLQLDNTGTNLTTLHFNSALNPLAAQSLTIGVNGRAALFHEDGINQAPSLLLALNGGSTGTYILAGGSLHVDGPTIGYLGTGIFNHSGGSHLNDGFMTLAADVGSSGTYNMSNGASLSSFVETIGRAGLGIFNQSGGTHTVSNPLGLRLGEIASGEGIVNLTGGSLSAATTFLGGSSTNPGGKGTLNVLGGTMTVADVIKSWNIDSTVTVNGGTLSAGSLDLPNWDRLMLTRGTLNLTGGVSSNAGQLTVGREGSGLDTATIDLSAGTLHVEQSLTLGVTNRNKGIFNQSGGTHSARFLNVGLGAPGEYNLDAGVLEVREAEFVGHSAVGSNIGPSVFNQTGGVHTIVGAAGLSIGVEPSGTGTVNLSGGLLTAPNVYLGGTSAGSGSGKGTLNLTGGVMNVETFARVWNGGSALNINGGTMTAAALDIGVSTGSAAATLGSGSLNIGVTYVGQTSAGVFNQTGGVHAVNNLYVGTGVNSNGTYTMSGNSTLNVSTVEVIGYLGTGQFTQSGGTHTISGPLRLWLGVFPGATGTFNLTGGTLTTPGAFLGGSDAAAGGVGTLNITGGQMTVSGVVKGWNTASTVRVNGGTLSAGSLELPNWDRLFLTKGTLNLTGGVSSNAGSLIVGREGSGLDTATINLSAGTLDIAEFLLVGAGNTGIFQQSGGTNSSRALIVGLVGAGAYTLNAGVLNVRDGEVVGNGAPGIFIQSGGVHTISGAGGLSVGVELTDVGTVHLSGGLLTTPDVYLGGDETGSGSGKGTLNITGGTMNVGAFARVWNGGSSLNINGGTMTADVLLVGASTGSAAASLSAGSLTDNNAWVGDTSHGVFSQTGGTHQAYNLILGLGSAGNGTYTMSGDSTLSVSNFESIGYLGVGQFTQSGGIHTISGGGMEIAALGGSTGTFNFTGGTLTAPRVIVGGTESTAGGTGLLDITGGQMTVTNGVKVWDFPSRITLNGGTLITSSLDMPQWNYLTFPMGTLTLTDQQNSTTGTFFFGSSTAAATLNLGGGTMNLSGSTLSVGDTGVGILNQTGGTVNSLTTILGSLGNGTYNHSGGTHAVSANLIMATNTGTSATYNMSNSANLSATILTVGNGGIATFNQNGGSVSIGALGMQLAVHPGATGTYNLGGGTLTSPDVYVGGNSTAAGGTATLNLTAGLMTVPGIVKVWNENSRITLDGGTLNTGFLVLPSWDQLEFASGSLNLPNVNAFVSQPGDLIIGTNNGIAIVNFDASTIASQNTLVGFSGGTTAVFNHNRGTHGTTDLTVGYNFDTTGIYNMGGDELIVTGTEAIGSIGTGTFTQTGGTHTIAAAAGLQVGVEAPGRGTFNLSGGTVNAPNVYLGGSNFAPGGTGTLNITGGTMTVPGAVKAWNANGGITINGGTLSAGSIKLPNWNQFSFQSGLLNLTGGASSNSGVLYIGTLAGGSAVATMVGGSVESDKTSVGVIGSGGFGQFGGTHRTVSLTLGDVTGSSGIYQMNGGANLISDGADIGFFGTGVLLQLNGTHSTGAVFAGVLGGSIGHYQLNNGVLQVSIVEHIGFEGTGSLTQNNGTHTITGAEGLNVGSGIGGMGTFSQSGGVFTAPNAYIGGTSASSGGTGSVSLSGGTMTVAGVVKVWNAGSSVNLNGGVLAAGALDIAAGPASMLTFDGGTWRHTGGNYGLTHDFTVNAGGATIDVQGNATLALTGNAAGAGTGHFTKTGTGRLFFNGSLAQASGVTLNQGVLGLSGAGQSVRSLRVEAGRALVGDPLKVGDDTSTTPLQMAGGQLDLTNDGLVVDFSPALHPLDAQAMTRIHIVIGYNSGAWNGAGIVSASAALDSTKAVGYALASDIAGAVGGSFMGIGGIDASTMLMRFTFKGDTDLDGQVGFVDLLKVAANFGKTGQVWVDGDSDYDQQVGFVDLLAVSANFGGALPAAIPGASDAFNAALADIHAGVVPEPGCAGLVMGAMAMMGRRGRRRSD